MEGGERVRRIGVEGGREKGRWEVGRGGRRGGGESLGGKGRGGGGGRGRGREGDGEGGAGEEGEGGGGGGGGEKGLEMGFKLCQN